MACYGLGELSVWGTIEKINSKELIPLANHFVRFLNRQENQLFGFTLSISLKWYKYPRETINELFIPNKIPVNIIQIHNGIRVAIWKKYPSGKQLLFTKYLISPLENPKYLSERMRGNSFKSEIALLKYLRNYGKKESSAAMPELIKGKRRH